MDGSTSSLATLKDMIIITKGPFTVPSSFLPMKCVSSLALTNTLIPLSGFGGQQTTVAPELKLLFVNPSPFKHFQKSVMFT